MLSLHDAVNVINKNKNSDQKIRKYCELDDAFLFRVSTDDEYQLKHVNVQSQAMAVSKTTGAFKNLNFEEYATLVNNGIVDKSMFKKYNG